MRRLQRRRSRASLPISADHRAAGRAAAERKAPVQVLQSVASIARDLPNPRSAFVIMRKISPLLWQHSGVPEFIAGEVLPSSFAVPLKIGYDPRDGAFIASLHKEICLFHATLQPVTGSEALVAAFSRVVSSTTAAADNKIDAYANSVAVLAAETMVAKRQQKLLRELRRQFSDLITFVLN